MRIVCKNCGHSLKSNRHSEYSEWGTYTQCTARRCSCTRPESVVVFEDEIKRDGGTRG